MIILLDIIATTTRQRLSYWCFLLQPRGKVVLLVFSIATTREGCPNGVSYCHYKGRLSYWCFLLPPQGKGCPNGVSYCHHKAKVVLLAFPTATTRMKMVLLVFPTATTSRKLSNWRFLLPPQGKVVLLVFLTATTREGCPTGVSYCHQKGRLSYWCFLLPPQGKVILLVFPIATTRGWAGRPSRRDENH